jgi:hypothetical protein
LCTHESWATGGWERSALLSGRERRGRWQKCARARGSRCGCRRRMGRSRASPARGGSPPPLLTTTLMRNGAAIASPSLWCRRCLLVGSLSIARHGQKFLRALAAAARAPSAQDSTVYGLPRASPRRHYPHHLSAISSAIVTADARIVFSTTPPTLGLHALCRSSCLSGCSLSAFISLNSSLCRPSRA